MTDIRLLDTTLRDGTQAEGISLSIEDKLSVARRLDDFGVHYIEGGWPASNPKDTKFFAAAATALKLKHARLTAFGSTRHKNRKASDDGNLKGLIDAKVPVVCIFGKAWDFQVREALQASLDENLAMISDSVRHLKAHGKEVIFDAEHFFDGYQANPGYALDTLRAAEAAGADWVVFCDTNGGALPADVMEAVTAARREVRVPLGIHAHNDGGLAVANTLAAVRAGCTQVHGTINGVGERCGNTDLCVVVPNLQLKMEMRCVPPEKLLHLTDLSRYVSEVANIVPSPNQPFVGDSAFAHKGGMHVSAVSRNARCYEHTDPKLVGNARRVLVSELAGGATMVLKARDLHLPELLNQDAKLSRRVLNRVKELEHQGYHFEGAEASFAILVHREAGLFKPYFTLIGFRVIVERDADGSPRTEATIRVKVDGMEEHTAAEGDGPVNALDLALRKALEKFYPGLKDVHLSDYKVRVINPERGTEAKVRVLVTSRDPKGIWSTLGVSENLLEASWLALSDSVQFKLLRDRVKRRES
jgi:2-isopropylmalate synthase